MLTRGALFWAAVTIAALAAMPTLANAAVIDFTGITPAAVSSPYNDPSGYTFTANEPLLDFQDAGGGNIVIINDNWQHALTLTKTDSGLFNLTSFDYAGSPWNDAAAATVTGTLGDNSTVTSSINGVGPYQTLTLNWTGLSSVTIAYSGSYGRLDNFVVSSDAAVPEPASLGLLALGGLALLRRR